MVLGVLTLVFLIRALVPGDPIEIMYFGQMPSGQSHGGLDPARTAGSTRRCPCSMSGFLGRWLGASLGRSVRTRRPVRAEIEARYKNTLLLAFGSLAVAVAVGLSMGILAAVHRDTPIDTVTMVLAMWGLSMPAFWFGLIMISLFSVRLRWLPVMGSDSLKHLILPAADTRVDRLHRSWRASPARACWTS